MQIVVAVKQISPPEKAYIHRRTGELRWSDELIINPADRNAVEFGLTLKESFNAKLTAVSILKKHDELLMRELLAMGVDNALLIADEQIDLSDYMLIAPALANAISKLNYDLILFGAYGYDWQYGQTAVRVADKLNLPVLTNVISVEKYGEKIAVTRLENGYEEIYALPLPAVLAIAAVTKRRYMQGRALNRAATAQIDSAPVEIDYSKFLQSYKLVEVAPRFQRTGCELILTGDLSAKIEGLMRFLRGKNFEI